MFHYHVVMEWAHGLHMDKFFHGPSLLSILIEIDEVIMDEHFKIESSRLENRSLPCATFTKLEVRMIQ